MADENESSVLFSLKELMNIEEDRIADEEAAQVASNQAAQDKRAAEELAARDAEEARVAADAARRDEEDARKREEVARLEAMKHGELERARSEAEAQAKLQTMASQQAHEQQLASIGQDKKKKNLQVMVGLGAFVLIAVTILSVVVFSRQSDEKAKAQAARDAEHVAFEAEKARFEEDKRMAEETRKKLEIALASAKDDATRAQIKAELEKNKRASGSKFRPRSGGGGKKAAPKKPACNCPPGDPLCSCF